MRNKMKTKKKVINIDDTKEIYSTLQIDEKNQNISDVISVDLTNEINDLYEKNPQLGRIPNKTWIQTFTGKKFFPLAPKQADICIEDIAHSLSMICRFTGHTKHFYSVAQHSVFVSYFCNTDHALWGLLHDASEAYICDLSSPLKNSGHFSSYKEIEKNLQHQIYNAFGIGANEPASVKEADILMLVTEAKSLLSPLHEEWKLNKTPLPINIVPLPPWEAEKLFLDRFNELYQYNDI